MRVAYIGYDVLFPALEALYESGCEIIKIFTCRTDNLTEFNREVSRFAADHAIPISNRKITRSDLEFLRDSGCDFALCGAYYYRIPVIPDFTVINIHPSALPKGRGAWPMPHVILRGDRETGVTFHLMAEEFDAGDILLQRRIAVDPEENLKTLTGKICAELPGMVQELVSNYEKVLNGARKQIGGEYERNPEEADWTVSAAMSCEEADRILRAFYGFECVYVNENHRIELIGGEIAKGNAAGLSELRLSDGWITAERIREL